MSIIKSIENGFRNFFPTPFTIAIFLTLIMCSSVESVCLPPFPWPQLFDDKYDCLQFGYQESYRKLEAVGREEVNKHGIYIKFDCKPSDSI